MFEASSFLYMSICQRVWRQPSFRFVSTCNTGGLKTLLIVTDRDNAKGWSITFRSVTDRGGITLLLLQIETKAGSAPVILAERGFSDIRAWKISRLENERG